MENRLSEVSQRWVRQPWGQLGVLGVLLGLSLAGLASCKTAEGTQVQSSANTPQTECKPLWIINLDENGFHPSDICLTRNGTLKIGNWCAAATTLVISDISRASSTTQKLVPGQSPDLPFPASGKYGLASWGCGGFKGENDAKTGTLEVSTDPGGGGPPQ